MDYKKIRRHQHWDRCDVLEALDQRRRQGKPLNCKAVEHDNCGLCHAATEIFGSYRKAIDALGLNYDSVLLVPRDVWSRQRVIERFHALKQQGADLWMAATRRRVGQILPDDQRRILALLHFLRCRAIGQRCRHLR